jgi:Domain of unknown function (DUF4160)
MNRRISMCAVRMGECKFWLEPIVLANNRGIAPHDLREIERLVFENKQILLDNYHEYHGFKNRTRCH